MKKVLSNRILRIVAGLAFTFCSLVISNMVFAADPYLVIDGPYTIDVNGRERDFKIYVPSGYDGSVAVPLMVDVHALWSYAWNQANATRYDLIAEKQANKEDQFISVYPVGTGGWVKSWNGGDGFDDYYPCCGNAQAQGVEDAAFIVALVEHMKANPEIGGKIIKIDSTRIYGSGFSNGSALIQKTIVENPNLFTAAFVTSQFLLEVPAPNLSLSVPILLTHGSEDTTAPYGGGVNGTGQEFPSAEDNLETWRLLNGCTQGPTNGNIGSGSECIIYSNCNVGEVKACKIIGGEHNHYNYKNAANESMAEIGWNFVKQYRK